MRQKAHGLGFLRDQRFLLLIILVVINVLFGLTSRNFFELSNYYNMLKQMAMIAITGSAATLLMMTGNFDLSTGSTVACTAVLYTLMATQGIPMAAAAALAVLAGVLVGVVNGTFVARVGIPPFIATLGMMYIVRGLGLVACNGRSIRENIPPGFSSLARGDFLGIPIPVYLIALFVLVFWLLERRSLLGKYAMAIGGNKNAAFFSGINAGAVIFWIFVMVGALAAFSGVMMASRFGAGDPRSGNGFEFDVIVAILLGGTSLSGGKGSVIGMLLGAMVVAMLGNGLDMLNVLTFWQSILKGAILVAAVILNEKILATARKRSAQAVTA
ncbi:MAG: ABC transporter permease [Spirochaetia bacterium]|jgi:ribose/xylose/arabinose/galactoside ABC-type transport system permease subunit